MLPNLNGVLFSLFFKLTQSLRLVKDPTHWLRSRLAFDSNSDLTGELEKVIVRVWKKDS